jgi:hypothetical protein
VCTLAEAGGLANRLEPNIWNLPRRSGELDLRSLPHTGRSSSVIRPCLRDYVAGTIQSSHGKAGTIRRRHLDGDLTQTLQQLRLSREGAEALAGGDTPWRQR